MGGKNPYIQETPYKPATKKYKITFHVDGETKEVAAQGGAALKALIRAFLGMADEA